MRWSEIVPLMRLLEGVTLWQVSGLITCCRLNGARYVWDYSIDYETGKRCFIYTPCNIYPQQGVPQMSADPVLF